MVDIGILDQVHKAGGMSRDSALRRTPMRTRGDIAESCISEWPTMDPVEQLSFECKIRTTQVSDWVEPVSESLGESVRLFFDCEARANASGSRHDVVGCSPRCNVA